MKIRTATLLLICFSASAKGLPQLISLSEKNAPIEKIFTQITQQTGYTFVYTESLVKQKRKVTLVVRDAALQQVLDICFRDQPVEYNIINKMVVIRDKDQLTEQPEMSMELPPPIEIRGSVKNEQGEPVAAATVTVKNTTIATQANSSGDFVINVPDENKVLVITSIGYEDTSFTVGALRNISIVLKVKSTMGKEVVIAAKRLLPF